MINGRMKLILSFVSVLFLTRTYSLPSGNYHHFPWEKTDIASTESPDISVYHKQPAEIIYDPNGSPVISVHARDVLYEVPFDPNALPPINLDRVATTSAEAKNTSVSDVNSKEYDHSTEEISTDESVTTVAPIEVDVPVQTRNTNEQENSVVSTFQEDAPVPALNITALKDYVIEFINSTDGFNAPNAMARIGILENKVLRSLDKQRYEVARERQKFEQIMTLLTHIRDVKEELAEFHERVDRLIKESLGIELLPKPSVGNHTSRATLYRVSNFEGLATEVDFSNCSLLDRCCINLKDLNDDAQSINTHGTCVILYQDEDCTGESQEYYPGSTAKHEDFDKYNDEFSSAMPCMAPEPSSTVTQEKLAQNE